MAFMDRPWKEAHGHRDLEIPCCRVVLAIDSSVTLIFLGFGLSWCLWEVNRSVLSAMTGLTALWFLFYLFVITASKVSCFVHHSPLLHWPSPTTPGRPATTLRTLGPTFRDGVGGLGGNGVLARSGMELRARLVTLEGNHRSLPRITDWQ